MKKKPLNYYISTIYISLMFILFPLIMHNKLFDIVETKRNWFVGITITTCILCLLSALTTQQKVTLKLSLTDILIICFVLSNLISYCFSSNKDLALYGSYGRAFGLFTIIFIGISYFIITRFCEINKFIFYSIMLGSSLVGIIGILNFFGIDPFGIYTNMAPYQTNFYISTLGHTNIYSSYFSITLPIGMIMYIKSSDNKNKLFFLITSLINFIGLISGNSDSGYITIAVILLFTPIVLKNTVELIRFAILLVSGIVFARLIGIIYTMFKCERLTDSITDILLFNNYLLLVALIFMILIYVLFHRIKHNKDSIKVIKNFILIAEGVVIIFFISVLIYANAVNYTGPLSNLLIWNDHWGSNRGFIWKRGFILFTQHYAIKDIIWGCGPDSIGPLLEHYFGNEMSIGIFEHYDNVHNEYLQYLLTLGITGLATYVGVIATTIKKHITKTSLDDSTYIAILSAVTCYLFQASVNINQAVTTPLFFIMIAMLNIKKE